MIRRVPEPSDRAASMYSCSRIDSVCPRTMRPIAAHEKKAITVIEIVRVGWNTETSAIATSRYGNDSTTSMKRASSRSTVPPK